LLADCRTAVKRNFRRATGAKNWSGIVVYFTTDGTKPPVKPCLQDFTGDESSLI